MRSHQRVYPFRSLPVLSVDSVRHVETSNGKTLNENSFDTNALILRSHILNRISHRERPISFVFVTAEWQ